MKYWILLSIIFFAFNSFANLNDCMCQENPADCNFGKLTCAGEITDGKSTSNFSVAKSFGPDDGFVPTASLRFRDFTKTPEVTDLSFYATSCDGRTGNMIAKYILWKNTPPDYPVLGIENKSFAIEKNLTTDFALSLKGIAVSGKCIFEKL